MRAHRSPRARRRARSTARARAIDVDRRRSRARAMRTPRLARAMKTFFFGPIAFAIARECIHRDESALANRAIADRDRAGP